MANLKQRRANALAPSSARAQGACAISKSRRVAVFWTYRTGSWLALAGALFASLLACSSAAVEPPVTVTETRFRASQELEAIVAELDELEEGMREAEDQADLEILRFRNDRLLADVVALMAAGEAHPLVSLTLGRALMLSAGQHRLGAQQAALQLFEQASQDWPGEASALCRLAVAYAEADRAEEAVESFDNAIALGSRCALSELPLAKALQAVGRLDEASELVAARLAQAPNDARALQQAATLTAGGSQNADKIAVSWDSEALLRYEVEAPTWRVTNETLGFRLGLPLSWQIVAQELDEKRGAMQIAAPPVIGAKHQWRHDHLDVHAIEMGRDASSQALAELYLGSFDDVELVQSAHTEEGGVLMQLRRAPFMEEELHALVYAKHAGNSGYLLEYWGDVSSFAQHEAQVLAIMGAFVPTVELASTPTQTASTNEQGR